MRCTLIIVKQQNINKIITCRKLVHCNEKNSISKRIRSCFRNLWNNDISLTINFDRRLKLYSCSFISDRCFYDLFCVYCMFSYLYYLSFHFSLQREEIRPLIFAYLELISFILFLISRIEV